MANAPQAQSARATTLPLLLRRDHLWFVLALSTAGVLVSLSPVGPIDFWWHLKIGQIIAQDGLPTTNIFSWALPDDAPFVYQSWLGEWLFYMLYEAGGLPLVVFARNLLWLSALLLVGLEARHRSDSWLLAAGAVLLLQLMAMNNISARTQSWSWVPFALLLLLLGSYIRGRLSARWLLVLPPLLLFWVNAHGAFAMGLLVLLACCVGETLRRLLRQPYAMPWPRLRLLYGASAGALLATLINPLGPGVYAYVYDLLTDPPSQLLVNEWQPPTPTAPAEIAFFVAVMVLIVALAFARRRPIITDMLLACGLLWLAFNGVRYVVWFGLAAMPIAAQCFGTARGVLATSGLGSNPRPATERPVGSPLINLFLAGLLLLGVVLVQPWFKPALNLPATYQSIFAPVPGAPLLFHAATPVEATDHLQEQPCSGRLFNDMGYGSYLIWELYPQAQVFVDPRVELYPLELWQDYTRMARGRDVAPLLVQYDIQCVLLNTAGQPYLSAALQALPGWQRTFASEHSEVWRRMQDA